MTAENSSTSPEGTPVASPAVEMQLVTAMAVMQADIKHMRETGDRTHDAVNGLSSRVSGLEADVAILKARPAVQENDPAMMARLVTLETTMTFLHGTITTVQAAINARALTWPKLLAGAGAVIAALAAMNYIPPAS